MYHKYGPGDVLNWTDKVSETTVEVVGLIPAPIQAWNEPYRKIVKFYHVRELNQWEVYTASEDNLHPFGFSD